MKLTAKEHGARITALLSEGLSYRQIADELGVNKDTVSIFVKVNFPELRRKPITAAPKPEPKAMKILLIDIETSPNLAYVWGLWQQNVAISQLVESTEILSFGAKWLGDDVIRFKSLFHNGKDEMIHEAHALLDQADAVMHYNGRRFDVPHLNREFIQADLLPPSPFKQIDLLETAKRRFRFPSNKLEYVSQALGLEGKVKHEGFELWVKCMAGDEAAWQRMYEYNIRDVQLLEDLYFKLLPWIERHPSYGALTSEDVCTNCGGSELSPHGYATTSTGKYPQYQCGDCGTFVRATKRTDRTQITRSVGG